MNATLVLTPSGGGRPPFPGADKIVHIILFGAVAWTGARTGARLRVLVPALVAYAIGTEIFQAVALPERTGDVRDVLADIVGIGLGLAVARLRDDGTVARHRGTDG